MHRLPFKMETQQNVKKLLELAHSDDSLLLLMYGSPDPDAIASAMALREILLRTKGLSRWVFASTEPIRRQQNRELAQAMRLNIRPLAQVDAGAYRLVALVDAQPSFLEIPRRPARRTSSWITIPARETGRPNLPTFGLRTARSRRF